SAAFALSTIRPSGLCLLALAARSRTRVVLLGTNGAHRGGAGGCTARVVLFRPDGFQATLDDDPLFRGGIISARLPALRDGVFGAVVAAHGAGIILLRPDRFPATLDDDAFLCGGGRRLGVGGRTEQGQGEAGDNNSGTHGEKLAHQRSPGNTAGRTGMAPCRIAFARSPLQDRLCKIAFARSPLQDVRCKIGIRSVLRAAHPSVRATAPAMPDAVRQHPSATARWPSSRS